MDDKNNFKGNEFNYSDVEKPSTEESKPKKDKKVSQKEYDKLMEQFEKAMATAAHHQNLSNYYKNEYDKMIKYRSQSVIEALLPSLDAFELSFKFEPKSDEARNYRAGFEYVKKMMLDSLINEGLEIVTPHVNDEFDSTIMQTVEVVETSDEKLVNRVETVLLNGYKLKDRLIRPASVKVYTLITEKHEENNSENSEENVSSNENKN